MIMRWWRERSRRNARMVEEAEAARQDAAGRLAATRRQWPAVNRATNTLETWVEQALRGGAG